MNRTPVIIFLSDGESDIEDETVQDVCHSAVYLGFVCLLFEVSRTEEPLQ
jgi:hypothetical protein